MMFHIYKLLQDEVQKFFHLQQLTVQLQISGLSRTLYLDLQDFPGRGNFTNTIPGLSRTLHLDPQDFPGPGNFINTIPGLLRSHRNPDKTVLLGTGDEPRLCVTDQ